MREIGDDRLVRARSRGSPLKGSTSLWGPPILVMLVLGLHIALDQLEIEATRHLTLVATSESAFFLFSCNHQVATKEGVTLHLVLYDKAHEDLFDLHDTPILMLHYNQRLTIFLVDTETS